MRLEGTIMAFLLASVLGCSCSSPKLARGMSKIGKETFAKQELFIPRACVVDTSFSISIDYKGEVLDGLLVKAREGDAQRLILNTYFGMTVFDFLLTENSMTVNRCMEQMNKKIVLNLLERDLRMLFLIDVPDPFVATRYVNANNEAYVIATSDGSVQYLVDTEEKRLKQAYKKGKVKELEITYAEELIVNHPKLKLKITLRR